MSESEITTSDSEYEHEINDEEIKENKFNQENDFLTRRHIY